MKRSYINIRQLANNQIVVMRENDEVFFSYESLIAIRNEGKIYLGSSWDYSSTTLKYLKQAFNIGHLSKKEIQKKLDDGEFCRLKDYKESK